MTVRSKLHHYTEHLHQQGLLRRRFISQPNDSTLIPFDSNDYLSLLGDRRIAQAYEAGYKKYESGSGASMLLSGYHANHQALEHAFTQLLDVDDCVLFSSGYAANLALTSLLGAIKVHCLIDKGIHASMYDGLRLSQAQYTRFLHNDLNSLTKKLMRCPQDSVVITEGIFSMSGQVAPLSLLRKLTHTYDASLLVDEAHSFGVLGEQGKGSVSLHHLSQDDVPLRVITFGKAFAAQGALVAGRQEWVDALLQAGRSIIYSTALSPALSYGLLKTLDIVVAADERREKLTELITYFNSKILASPLNWRQSNTAIHQVQLGCPHRALYYAKELREKGFSCSPIRAPTVNLKSTGLRIVLNSRHSPEQINSLFEHLHTIYEHQFN